MIVVSSLTQLKLISYTHCMASNCRLSHRNFSIKTSWHQESVKQMTHPAIFVAEMERGKFENCIQIMLGDYSRRTMLDADRETRT